MQNMLQYPIDYFQEIFRERMSATGLASAATFSELEGSIREPCAMRRRAERAPPPCSCTLLNRQRGRRCARIFKLRFGLKREYAAR